MILFNPRTGGQVARIREELKALLAIIDTKDSAALDAFLRRIRGNIK